MLYWKLAQRMKYPLYRLSPCWNHHCTSFPKEHWLVSLHCHDNSMKHTEQTQASPLRNAQPNLFLSCFWGCPLANTKNKHIKGPGNTHSVTPEGRSFYNELVIISVLALVWKTMSPWRWSIWRLSGLHYHSLHVATVVPEHSHPTYVCTAVGWQTCS